MAIPSIDLEVWAKDNVILPVSHQINKIRPLSDLWSKGYDQTEKPAAEEFNYVLNMITVWLKYLSEDAFPALPGTYLTRANNLFDVSDIAEARSNLSVYSKVESDDRYVNASGDSMVGILTVPQITFPASTGDFAYIKSSLSSTNATNLDIVIGKDTGESSTATNDKIRLRHHKSNGADLSILEAFSVSDTSGQVNVNGLLTSYDITSPTATITNLKSTSLVVSGNTATVGGKNVIRTVNGINANTSGEVIIDLGVNDVRLGAVAKYATRGEGQTIVPTGCVQVGVEGHKVTGSNSQFSGLMYRPLQKLVGGSWVTVSVAG